MKAGVHYDYVRTAPQTPSHTARRLILAEEARDWEFVRSIDVPGGNLLVSNDPRYNVTLLQPRCADGTLSDTEKVV